MLKDLLENLLLKVHRGNLEEVVKTILAMPPLKKTEPKPIVTPHIIEEPVITKPQPVEDREDDRIDFVNVKDMIKGMERQTIEPKEYNKETNGFHKKITDNHDCTEKEDCDKIEEESVLEKNDSLDSTESLSRSNSLINGVQIQAPKPLPRSSISEAGSMDEHSEAPKPKPRTTTSAVGYKVFCVKHRFV